LFVFVLLGSTEHLFLTIRVEMDHLWRQQYISDFGEEQAVISWQA